MKRIWFLFTLSVALNGPFIAKADEITLVAPGGMRGPIEQMIPDFEEKTGHKVTTRFVSGGVAKAQAAQGENFDIAIVQPPYKDVLASGNVIAGSAKPLASVAVGMAVRAGSPKPNIATTQGLKRALVKARAIAFPNGATGATAGIIFDDMLTKLGLAQELAAKLKRAPGGAAAMALVANGEADVGVTYLSEMTDPGISIVGPLPRAAAVPTVEVAFLSSHAANPNAARAFLDYLSSARAAKAYEDFHMIPEH